MNKKAQETIFFKIGVATMVIIAAVALLEPFVMSNNDMEGSADCTNASIGFGQKAGCVIFDMIPFYFYWMVLAGIGGFVASRIIVSRGS